MMWLALACGIISGIGLAILGYYAGKENWLGRDRQTTAPVRHRMQEIDTAQIVTAMRQTLLTGKRRPKP